MKGGFRYGTRSKKRSKSVSKNKLYKSNTKKLLAGKLKKLKKMKKKNINFLKKLKVSNKLRLSKKNKHTRRMRKMRRTKRCKKVKCYRKSYKQRGGNNPLGFSYLQDITGEPLPARLPAGVHFNTSAGFGAELSNPPISGITPNTQCTNM